MVKTARYGEVRGFIGGLYGPDLHAKRVDALAGATLGVMSGASLAVSMIGQALAQARGLVTKHAVKQVDRLMSNAGIDVWDSFARWVPRQVGECRDILVAMEKDSGRKLKILRVDGGAVSNDLLMQMQADFLGVNVQRPKQTESTSLGAAYLAGLGVGFWNGLGEVKKIWALENEFKPVMKTKDQKNKLQQWHRAVERVRG